MQQTYLSARQLAQRIPYSPRTIQNNLKDSVLIEGVHYIRPFGRRKIFYIWEPIERDLTSGSTPYAASKPTATAARSTVTNHGRAADVIPMANGGYCHG